MVDILKMVPVEFKVKVRMDKVEEYSGEIIIPPVALEKQQVEQDSGTIVAVGGRAFERFGDPFPEVGDKVMLIRNAGYIFYHGKGKDRVIYKIVNDKDITMIEAKEEENG